MTKLPLPTDRQVDRRGFLRRFGMLTAAATTGSFEAVWRAAPLAGSVQVPASALPGASSGLQETDPANLTLIQAANLIREGGLSPEELLEACLERVRRLEGLYQAFNTVTEEVAVEAARSATEVVTRARRERGVFHPLAGIPLGVKDNFFTAGIPTTANSHIFADFVPEYDAEAWLRLRRAGAVLVGKTQMGPLATSRATTPDGVATTRNAWAPLDDRVSPGGSSSGSATVVAGRMALAATGTQTGGSITNPADAQGLTGIKPTMGRVSLRGVIPLTYTRDHAGPLARDAQDAALLLQTMAGRDPADPRTLGQPALPDLVAAATPQVDGAGRIRLPWATRIGILPGYLDDSSADRPEPPPADADPQEDRRYQFRLQRWERQQAGVEARRRMLATFRELGAEVVEVPFPAEWETLTSSAFNNVRLPERSEPFLEYLQQDVRLFGVSLSPWINGLLLPGTEYLRGQRARALLLQRIVEDIFSRCDVVVQTSPIPFDMTGLPLISFPMGFRETGQGPLPLGALFGGMPWAEDRLLSLAGAFQAVTDWHRGRPADPALDVGPGGSPAEAGDVNDAQDGARRPGDPRLVPWSGPMTLPRRQPPGARTGDGDSPLRLDVLDVWEECQ